MLNMRRGGGVEEKKKRNEENERFVDLDVIYP